MTSRLAAVAAGLLAVGMILTSCSDTVKLVSVIQSTKADHQFSVADGTNWSWDRLYVFPPYTPAAEIDKAVGHRVDDAHKGIVRPEMDIRDDICLLVFTKGDSVATVLELPRTEVDFSQAKSPPGGYGHDVRLYKRVSPGSAPFVTSG